MVGIYFSGTGNTKHCIQKFVHEVDPAAQCLSIEEEKKLIQTAYDAFYENCKQGLQ